MTVSSTASTNVDIQPLVATGRRPVDRVVLKKHTPDSVGENQQREAVAVFVPTGVSVQTGPAAHKCRAAPHRAHEGADVADVDAGLERDEVVVDEVTERDVKVVGVAVAADTHTDRSGKKRGSVGGEHWTR